MGHHVIIAGYPRAGTTLLYNMLREVVRGYETFDREMKAEKARQQTKSGYFISKRPTDMADAAELLSKYNDITFVLCVRDPRSILVSEHDHAPGQYKISWDKALKTNKNKGVVGKAPGFLERHEKLIKVPSEFSKIVFYEQLVREPDIVQGQLAPLFNYQFNGKFSAVHTQSPPPERLALQLNGVRPVETSRIDSWKNHPHRIYKQFTQCPTLFSILEYWGYERNSLWFDEIINQVKQGA